MRLPIQYALTYPERVPCKMDRLNLAKVGKMTFFAPDETAFPALKLARKAASLKGNMGAVMNVQMRLLLSILKRKNRIFRYSRACKRCYGAIKYKQNITLDDVIMYDKQARELVNSALRGN